MQQYLDLLKSIKKNGTVKPAARPGMPGSLSLFGYQYRHDLADGFPLLTTKKIYFKGVVTELLWFLRGDTNIKFLIDNDCNIWNQDAYNYYLKKMDELSDHSYRIPFDAFIELIAKGDFRWKKDMHDTKYKLGDCGYQYGKVWRDWKGFVPNKNIVDDAPFGHTFNKVDQIKNVINSIRNTPESRRHIVTAIDPAHDQELALYWCHALFQFNCRPLTKIERATAQANLAIEIGLENPIVTNYPKYYLDCNLYQRSADVVLGVPFNLASYALLINIIAKITNTIPGHFIHSFGDVHIYDNHMDAVEEQLSRTPKPLGVLWMDTSICWEETVDKFNFTNLTPDDFSVENYDPYPAIKAKLSTGLN